MLILPSVLPTSPGLCSDTLKVYYAKDSSNGDLPVLIFYGPYMPGATNSSRIQAHIYSVCGFRTFSRVIVAPTSPSYAAVQYLPAEQQGYDVCRGLAFVLLKYFAELPETVKHAVQKQAVISQSSVSNVSGFDARHAGALASVMVEAQNKRQIINQLTSVLSTRAVSWIDLDVILPRGTISPAVEHENTDDTLRENAFASIEFGQYNAVIESLGTSSFLPTSKLRRAPSRPTASSKSRQLLRVQKLSLRREMRELLDTEERFLGKVHDLVHLSRDFRKQAKVDAYSCGISKVSVLESLFPSSLGHVLEVNTAFLDDLRKTWEESEDDAIRDVESDIDMKNQHSKLNSAGSRKDMTGASAFAKNLLKWFPAFMEPYQQYMRTSTSFPEVLTECLRENSSGIARLIQEFGEQRLRSMLIEPVQRLPRYSLFIDSMVNELPASHSAMGSLLKAKDIIADICALDENDEADSTMTTKRLRNIVPSWPQTLSSQGRLITAVDAVDLAFPYAPEASSSYPSMLLLFPSMLVVLRKVGDRPLSARGLIAELDRPCSSFGRARSDSASLRSDRPKDLEFVDAYSVDGLCLCESENGQLIWMVCEPDHRLDTSIKRNFEDKGPFIRVMSLLGSYERKAARFSEEVARARVEGRFSEPIRESGKWCLRNVDPCPGRFGIVAAVFEEGGLETAELLVARSRTRVRIDIVKESVQTSNDIRDTEVTCSITPFDGGSYRLLVQCCSGYFSTDEVISQDLARILAERLGESLRRRYSLEHQPSYGAYTSYHHAILSSITLVPAEMEVEKSDTRSIRPVSPVKLLSNIFGGNGAKDAVARSKDSTNFTPHSKDLPPMPTPVGQLPRTNSAHSINDSKEGRDKVTLVAPSIASGPEKVIDRLALLEDTFTAFIIALRSRSGNVVGRVLRGRSGADELAVNELYNILIEDPSEIKAAAEVSVDVLFVAFEKFLRSAWRERMGSVLAPNILKSMQSRFDLVRPDEAGDQFRSLLEEMTPQNKRAFATMIKLLSTLLDASGNDGDRGALIASFAEALVYDGNPHEYITLLDRLVEDYEMLFGNATNVERNLTGSATNSLQRNRSVNTGSLSSNASSLRKRFGFSTLSRENSKSESESKVASVWRTLSKNTKNIGEPSQVPNTPNLTLLRSRSTDHDARTPVEILRPPSRDRLTGTESVLENSMKNVAFRPCSRDRSVVLEPYSKEEPLRRPGSGHLNSSNLSSIGEGTSAESMPPPLTKKKRRSSLSDLRNFPSAVPGPAWSPLEIRKKANSPQLAGRFNTAPRTPSPNKQALSQRADQPSPQRLGSPSRKENLPSISRQSSPKRATHAGLSEIVVTSYTPSPRPRIASRSSIPAPKVGLSERTLPVNAILPSPKPLQASPQKLRIQSPQKLRERLENEQKATSSAETSLQAELAKIGEEISTFSKTRSAKASASRTMSVETSRLASWITDIESRLSILVTDLTTRTSTAQKDVENSLAVSERKARKLDDLYKEANAENEALYERFNGELAKILSKVRTGHGVEEMRIKMKEAQDEVMKLKKENQRLKRDNVGLRSQLPGG